MKYAPALLLSIISLGCASVPEVKDERQRKHPEPRRVTFDPAEYGPYGAEGTAIIEGEAFIKTRTGDVKLGAGEKVYLKPVTGYSSEWFERVVEGGEVLEPPDPRSYDYYWERVAGGAGRFRFERLPPGQYYLACLIRWEVPEPPYVGGGWARARVSVSAGETARVIVSHVYAPRPVDERLRDRRLRGAPRNF